MSILQLAMIFFIVTNPIGNCPTMIALVKGHSISKQQKILFRELLIALAVMIGFNYLGEYIFTFLDISETTVRLSSGLILFLIAIKILFTSKDGIRTHLPSGEPFIFPLAIPLIAGPALLATIMLYAHLEKTQSIMLLAILIAWLLSVAILYFAAPIKRVLGESGLIASERLIGMVLVLIAVQRFLEGVLLFWSTQPNPV